MVFVVCFVYKFGSLSRSIGIKTILKNKILKNVFWKLKKEGKNQEKKKERKKEGRERGEEEEKKEKDPFGPNLTDTVSRNQIRSGLGERGGGVAHYHPGRLWKNATESEKGTLVANQMRSARTPAWFRNRCVWPKPDRAIQIGSGSVLYSTTRAFFWRTELNRMLEVGSGRYTIRPDPGCMLAVTGPNWP